MRIPTPRRFLTIAALLLALHVPLLRAGDGAIRKKESAVRDEYIVVLRSDVPAHQVKGLAHALAAEHGSQPETIWTAALKGFLVRMPAGRAQALSRHPLVDFVEENGETYTSASVMPTNVDPALCNLPDQQNCAATADNRLWHLDRIDQDSAVPSKTFSYCPSESPVTIYVVDLGVEGDHTEFLQANGTSRVTIGINASGDEFPANDPCGGPPAAAVIGTIDTSQYNKELSVSHGTGTASLAAGKKIGVAKNATIVPVKVARCDAFKSRRRVPDRSYNIGERVYDVTTPSGSSAQQLHKHWIAVQGGTAGSGAATNWQPDGTGHFQDGGVKWREYQAPTPAQTTAMLISGFNGIVQHRQGQSQPAVATVSVWEPIGSPEINALQAAVQNVIAAGVAVIASANNQNGNACNQAPGAFSRFNTDVNRRGSVITVGGSMLLNDPEASYDATQPTRDGRWVCTQNCLEPGSNGGPCVTLFAPAKGIGPASSRTSTDYRDRATSSGTSWSAPIVAGVVARYLQSNASLPVEGVYQRLLADASEGLLDSATLDPPGVSAGSTPNRLLRMGDVRITTGPQDSGSTASAPAQLTVVASGAPVLGYQWFRVNTGFDPAARRGAASSVLLVGETGSTLSNLHPQTKTGYWVRVTGCGAADSNIAYVTPSTTAPVPTGLGADTNPDRTVTVHWSAAGADAYVVQRKIGTADWSELAVVTGTSHIDSTIPLASAALYRVRSRMNGPPVVDSEPSNVDFAHGWLLTDLSIQPLVTTVRALHLTELRAILNQITDTAGLSRQYSDAEALESALKPNVLIDDSHVAGLMTKINAMRTGMNIANAGFGTVPAGLAPVYATQIHDLRNALK